MGHAKLTAWDFRSSARAVVRDEGISSVGLVWAGRMAAAKAEEAGRGPRTGVTFLHQSTLVYAPTGFSEASKTR